MALFLRRSGLMKLKKGCTHVEFENIRNKQDKSGVKVMDSMENVVWGQFRAAKQLESVVGPIISAMDPSRSWVARCTIVTGYVAQNNFNKEPITSQQIADKSEKNKRLIAKKKCRHFFWAAHIDFLNLIVRSSQIQTSGAYERLEDKYSKKKIPEDSKHNKGLTTRRIIGCDTKGAAGVISGTHHQQKVGNNTNDNKTILPTTTIIRGRKEESRLDKLCKLLL
ncbi:hypothetical protein Tco_0522559 [Tanacetum coccineum]